MSEASESCRGSSDENGASGFSLVEVLIALALASLLAIAIGTLISFGLTLSDRTERTDTIINALVEVNAFTSILEAALRPPKNYGIVDATASGFGLTDLIDPEAPVLIVGLTLAADSFSGKTFSAKLAGTTSSVDLSMFAEVTIDYLSSTGHNLKWSEAVPESAPYLAARLVLNDSGHRWTFLLWI